MKTDQPRPSPPIWRRGTCLVAVLLALALPSGRVQGFSGEVVLAGKPFYHPGISTVALELQGFDAQAAASVAWPADFIDSYLYSIPWWLSPQNPWEKLDTETSESELAFGERYVISQAIFDQIARLHFDDLTTSDQVDYLWTQLYSGTVAGLIWAAQNDDLSAAQHLLGMSLHMVQDFYSHSSWMDYVDRRNRTYFEVPANERLYPGQLADDLTTGAYEKRRTSNKNHGKVGLPCAVFDFIEKVGKTPVPVPGSLAELEDAVQSLDLDANAYINTVTGGLVDSDLPLLELDSSDTRIFGDFLCASGAPTQAEWYCEQYRMCQAGVPTDIAIDATEFPAPLRSLLQSEFVTEGLLVLNPPGIALDNRQMASVGMVERGLADAQGNLLDSTNLPSADDNGFDECLKINQRVMDADVRYTRTYKLKDASEVPDVPASSCTLPSDPLISAAVELAARSSSQWIVSVGKALGYAGYGDFWERMKTESTLEKKEEQFEDFGRHPYLFISSMKLFQDQFSYEPGYPPPPTVDADQDEYYLRLKLVTADAVDAGTDADVFAKVAGVGNGDQTRFELGHEVDLTQAGEIAGELSRLADWDDFEREDVSAYVIGPFSKYPESVQLQSRTPFYSLDVLQRALLLLEGLYNDIVALFDFFFENGPDWIGAGHVDFRLDQLPSAGASDTKTYTVTSETEGEFVVAFRVEFLEDVSPMVGRYELTVPSITPIEESEWDQGSDSDEIYMMMTATATRSREVQPKLTEPYPGVDAGDPPFDPGAGRFVFETDPTGMISIEFVLEESDDEKAEVRQARYEKFLGIEQQDVVSAIDVIGAVAGADWEVGKVEVSGFRRGRTIAESCDLMAFTDRPYVVEADGNLTFTLGSGFCRQSNVGLFFANAGDIDSDGDGIIDRDEASLNSLEFFDPLDPDTDGDGTNDGDQDYDGDGLTSKDELEVMLTDPLDADSDGDGLNDRIEYFALEFDPNVPESGDFTDTDGDFLTDRQELALGTNRFRADSDFDGLCDGGIAVSNGFDDCIGGFEDVNRNAVVDPGETDPNLVDTDGDGLSDFEEAPYASLDPTLPNSDGSGPGDEDDDHDGDGLTNGEEVKCAEYDAKRCPRATATGTSPDLVDTDGDGLSDFIEVQSSTGIAFLTHPAPGRPTSRADIDAFCVDEAVAAGLESPTSFVGFVSTSTEDAILRPRLLDRAYDFAEGSPFINDLTELYYRSGAYYPAIRWHADGTLMDAAALLAAGAARTSWSDQAFYVSTGSTDRPTGEYSEALGSCGDWTTQTGTHSAGAVSATIPPFPSNFMGGLKVSCSEARPLYYCFGGGSNVPTDALSADTDGDGLCDGSASVSGVCVGGEDLDDDGIVDPGETDPNNPDSDFDGLTDGDEVLVHASDPFDADSDDDGLLDGEEVTAGSDPTLVDTDGDNLSDYEEVKTYLTDPSLADTDGDALNDDVEVNGGSDPLSSDAGVDPDGDGVDIPAEYAAGTNPYVADTDGDGIDDGVEIPLLSALDPDSDGDGLCDGGVTVPGVCVGGYEDTNGNGIVDGGETNPFDADSDDDGLDDGAEAAIGSNPLLADTDGDGLTDAVEVNVHESDPTLVDTDGDGFDDEEEVLAHGTLPGLADSDGDGLDDAQEVSVLGSDPRDRDTDGDGLSDGFEVANGFAIDDADTNLDDVPDGLNDADSDGLTNAGEERAGTDPNLQDSDLDGALDGAEIGYLAPQSSAGTITTVLVGAPGNAADDTGFGSVAGLYAIGRTEVTVSQWVDLLNAVATVNDPALLYRPGRGVVRSGSPGAYSYASEPGFGLIPIEVELPSARRFVNWLQNGRPVGLQSQLGTTEDGAYADPDDPTGAPGANARFALPTEDEWYKAAYYEAETARYFDYPTGSDTPPVCGAPTSAPDTANCGSVVGAPVDVGSYPGSPSPSGTLDQGGNAEEWLETPSQFSSLGRVRGGDFASANTGLSAAGSADEESVGAARGFRIVVRQSAASATVGFGTGAIRVGVGDMDGDGDADVVALNPDRLAWYENRLDAFVVDPTVEPFVEWTLDNDLETATDLVVVDLDRDGAMDVVVASAGGASDRPLAWYENRGAGDFRSRTIWTSTDEVRLLAVGDVDGDGDLDVVASDHAGADDDLGWHENDGLQGFSYHLVDGTPGVMADLVLADVDGVNPRPEIVTTAGSQTLAWYPNVGGGGAGQFGARIDATVPSQSIQRIVAADLSGDGIDDLLVSRLSGAAWYTNVFDGGAGRYGDFDAVAETLLLTDAGATTGPLALADLLGNGSLDALVGNTASGAVTWLQIDSVATIGSFQEPFGTLTDLAASDFDGDGTYDVLLARSGGLTLERRNRGPSPLLTDTDADGLDDAAELAAGTAPSDPDTDGDGLGDAEEIGTSLTDPLLVDTDADGLSDYEEYTLLGTDPLLADTDGDGLIDGEEVHSTRYVLDPLIDDSGRDMDRDGLTVAEELALGTDPLRADTDFDGLLDGFEAAHGFDPLGTDESRLDGDADGVSNLQEQRLKTDPGLADTDGDGLTDGAENAKGVFASAQALPIEGKTSLVFEDMDQDGDLDFVATTLDTAIPEYRLEWIEQEVGSLVERRIDGTINGYFDPRTGDLTGDGFPDIVARKDATLVLQQMDSTRKFTGSLLFGDDGGFDDFLLFDMDRDGDADILAAQFFGTNAEVAWYENDGSGGLTERLIAFLSTASVGPIAQTVSAIDLDGDGDVDVVADVQEWDGASSYQGYVIWYENDGFFNFTPHPLAPLYDETTGYLQRSRVGDLDGDGDGDIAVATEQGFVGWYENDGAQNFTLSSLSGAFVRVTDLLLADLEGDGDPDLLVRDIGTSDSTYDDTVTWLENDGSGGFAIGQVIAPPQSLGITEDGAYTITDAALSANTVTRNAGALYFLPSENEWYKAAYRDAQGGIWVDYPTGTDTVVTCAVPGGGANLANCGNVQGTPTDAGAYPGSPSPAGTYDQAGNVQEWTESVFGPFGIARGGSYTEAATQNGSGVRLLKLPTENSTNLGFRVAAAPGVALPGGVLVGEPGLAADPGTGYGSVAESFQISDHEVTNAEYGAFLNAVAKDDDLGLYNASMGLGQGGITRALVSGRWEYTVVASRADWPVLFVDYADALRYVNWLHNGMPVDPSGPTGNITVGDLDEDGDLDIVIASDGPALWYEQVSDGNPTRADTDGDGLLDSEELAQGTDPFRIDTDGDGIRDGVEVNELASDPLDPDTDGDGLCDGPVGIAGVCRGGDLDPVLADLDGDGFTDGEEVAVGSSGYDPDIVPGAGRLGLLRDQVWFAANAGDDAGSGLFFGAVDHAFSIGRFEVTNQQYARFLSAVAAVSDPAGLYRPEMSSDTVHGGIDRFGTHPSARYFAKRGAETRPVAYVSFWSALRFANWMHNGQPVGVQGASTTEDGAYTLTPGGIAANSVVRNPDARAFLPTEDEWYKAAFYAPLEAPPVYFDSATSTDAPTVCAGPGGAANAVNCNAAVGESVGVELYLSGDSPFGTFQQGGNVREWTESAGDLVDERRVRGGGFLSTPGADAAGTASRESETPGSVAIDLGFRIAFAVDRDRDGVFDTDETLTDATLPDSDGDGMSDGFELRNGFDPTDGDENLFGGPDGTEDADLDGLSNADEERMETDPLVADTDGDGLPDGVESLAAPFEALQALSGAVAESKAIPADLDRDGDLDIVYDVAVSGLIEWQENVGGSFVPGGAIAPFVSPGDFGVADLDDDGDLDVFASTTAPFGVSWYEQVDIGGGALGWTAHVVATGLPAAPLRILAADADADDDLDLVAGDATSITTYRNGPVPTDPASWLADPVSTTHRLLAVGDIDANEQLDVLSTIDGVGGLFWHASLGVKELGVELTAIDWEAPRALPASSAGVDVRAQLVDLDSDGQLDVLYTDPGTGSAHWLHSDGQSERSGDWLEIELVPAGAAAALSFVIGDFDGDQDLDLLYSGGGDTRLMERGSVAGRYLPGRVVDPGSYDRIVAADLDRDLLPDLLTLDSTSLGWLEGRRMPSPTDPDVDRDGLCDGLPGVPIAGCSGGEDLDNDGVLDAGESSALAFDTDGDGLSDSEEGALATDPRDVDTDGDLLTDYFEVLSGLDPLIADAAGADPDGDGLSSLIEQAAGTLALDPDTDRDGLCDGGVSPGPVCVGGFEDVDADGVVDANETSPVDADSDDDGASDGQEVALGIDPLAPDTDSDGLLDGDEITLHATAPDDPDTDDDLLLDGFEVASPSLDPLDGCCDADSDADGDRLVALGEQTAGTNPDSPDLDQDGLGDGAEVLALFTDPASSDSDGDGVPDDTDVCAQIPDPLQEDADGDGRGDVCDYNDPVDLADPTARSIVVQFEQTLEPGVVGVTFDDGQLPASYVAAGNLRTITIAAADFESSIATRYAFGFDPGTLSDYVLVIDASTGALVSADWSADRGGETWMASATSSASGGTTVPAALGGARFFCDAALHGPCPSTVRTAVYDPATGSIAGLGGIDVPSLNVDPAPNDLLNPIADLRLAEISEPFSVIDFESVVPAGQELPVASYYEGDFVLRGVSGPDQEAHLFSASAPGVGVVGTDFALFENNPDFTLEHPLGLPFVLEGFEAAQAFGAAPGILTVTGTRFDGGVLQTTFGTSTDAWAGFQLGWEWSGLASVEFSSDQDFLAVDNIEVVPALAPEPSQLLLIGSGVLGLMALARRRGAGSPGRPGRRVAEQRTGDL